MQKLEKKVSAVLVAAGSSTRMGFDKLSFDLGGETVVQRSIRAFAECPLVSEIVLVAGKNRAFLEQQAAACTKPVQVVQGGATRAESAKNGVLAAHGELVAAHDAARPFVSQAVITAALEAAAACGAAAPAVPVKDTVKRAVRGDGKTVPEHCMVTDTPDRSTLYAVQTPQCFDRAAYLAALDELDAEKARLVTDDCSLFELTGRPVQLTQGDYANLKITTREDLPRAEQKEGNDMRIGHGYDVHRLVEGRKLILGGVEVPFEKGLLGHSDADVLAHAVMDAVLGAAALQALPGYRPRLRRCRQPAAGAACGTHHAGARLEDREHRFHPALSEAQAGSLHPRHAGKSGRSLRDAGGCCERQGHHRGASGLYRRGPGHCRPCCRPDREAVTGETL